MADILNLAQQLAGTAVLSEANTARHQAEHEAQQETALRKKTSAKGKQQQQQQLLASGATAASGALCLTKYRYVYCQTIGCAWIIGLLSCIAC